MKHLAVSGSVMPSSGSSSKRSSFSKRLPTRKLSMRVKEKAVVADDDDDEKGHPGPIFLANVVTQQYRYRWMVAAISVFVTMTIIVVISVIYSNQ